MAQNFGLEREYLKIMNCEKIQTFNNYYIYDHVHDKSLDRKVACKVAFRVPMAYKVNKHSSALNKFLDASFQAFAVV